MIKSPEVVLEGLRQTARFHSLLKNAKDGVVVQDPFADKSNQNYHREIQMWMTVLMCLLVAFLYLAFKRMSGSQDEIPAHILQSSVAQATPPIDYDSSHAFRPPQPLSSVPPVRSGSFSTNLMPPPKLTTNPNPVTKPDFGFANQTKTSNRFPSVELKPAETAVLKSASLKPPQPTHLDQNQVKTVHADNKAEAIGRRRAKQLAELTSGLPERLNQIQSSVKQATAELPVEEAAAKSSFPDVANNGFVPSSPLKLAVRSPLKPAVEPPKQFDPEESFEAVKRIPIRPVVAKTFAVKPLEKFPAIEPVRSPAAVVEPPKSNAFAPLPSLRPIAKPEVSKAAVEVPGRSNVVESTSKATETVKPMKPMPDSSRDLKQHVVQAGDSFFTIAQQHYGDAQWFRALRLANQSVVTGGELPVGLSLAIPTTEELASQFPEYAVRTADEQPTEAEQRIYVTQAGDTLFDIARRKTGQGSRFSEILISNQFRLPAQIRASDQLSEGIRLVLPEFKLE